MRINKYVAAATGLSRRAADAAIAEGRVRVNDQIAPTGYNTVDNDVVTLDGSVITSAITPITLLFHKPVGFVVSRNGQGSKTIYDILPPEFHALKPVGRLDKDSSGLLLLTNDGVLAEELTHPRYKKYKIYEITLNKPLQPLHRQMVHDYGIQLSDGPSRLQLERQTDADDTAWIVTMHEGRNRQIRRTFEALGYKVTRLHRIQFGDYRLGTLPSGQTTAA